MDCASRAVVDRKWRPANKSRGLGRACSVRVVAFNESRRVSPGAPPAPATTTTGAAVVRPVQTSPLRIDCVGTLPPAVLASSLVDYAQRVAVERPEPCRVTPEPDVGQRMFDAVARRLAESVYDFDAHSLVDVLHAYSRAGQGRSNRDVLAICCVVLSGKVKQRLLTETVLVCGLSPTPHGIQDSDAIFYEQVDELAAASLVCLADACALMDLQATDLLSALCTRAGEPDVLTQFTSAELVTLLVALSRLQHRSPTLYAEAADRLTTELQRVLAMETNADSTAGLNPQQAVSAIWAMAAAGLYHRPLFDAAGLLLMDRLDQLDGNTLAKIAWSYATVRAADESHRALRDRDLFDSIAGACLESRVRDLPPRTLVTLLWSFASIPHYDGPLFNALASALTPHLAARALSPSDLVAVASSVVRVAHAHVGLMEALGEAALAAAEHLDGDDMTTIAMAFPAAKAYSEPYFKYLVSEAQERPQFFGQVVLLDIIRLISRVQHREPAYYGPALQVLLEHVHKAFLDAPVDKVGCMNPFRFG